jgi:hypothetical protein
MVVSQVRHLNTSKAGRVSCVLLACMATPQTGQCRITGRGREFIRP